MNYFEFRQQLLTDSFTKDEEFHRLRKEDIRCAKAYAQAMEFEKTLKQAFEIKTPDNLKDSIILRQATNHTIERSFRKYAIAASLFMSILVVSAAWYINKPGSIEQFIIESLALESNISMSQQPMSLQEVKNVFAEFKTQVNGNLGRVHFIHNCHTPGGRGVHMVVSTEAGLVTIFYMPKTKLDKERINFDINNDKAVLVAMQKGSIAIIANTSQQLASIEPILQNNLLFL